MAATATTTTTVQSVEAGKQKGVFKKVLKYLQDQAIENSNSRSFVSPPGLEPHQKVHYISPHNKSDPDRCYIRVPRRLSDATTVVDPRVAHRLRNMTEDGTDTSVSREPSICKELKKVQYAQDNILQNYQIYIPERNPDMTTDNQYWIIYIHGGYFRDPKIDASTFRPALELLTGENFTTAQPSTSEITSDPTESSQTTSRNNSTSDQTLLQNHIAGYVSLNYRLSPNSTYPQPPSTSDYLLRNAEFPQHLNDIHAAIRHLQTRYDIGTNYILAGHSVGATLAFLAALRHSLGQIDPPSCVVGLNGIYDFPALHRSHPDYEAYTRNAVPAEMYRDASPALYGIEDFENIVPKEMLKVVLSHSRDDGLVDWEQGLIMLNRLNDVDSTMADVEFIETKGQHDEIWAKSSELARVLTRAVQLAIETS